jgi:hypothetical protein
MTPVTPSDVSFEIGRTTSTGGSSGTASSRIRIIDAQESLTWASSNAKAQAACTGCRLPSKSELIDALKGGIEEACWEPVEVNSRYSNGINHSYLGTQSPPVPWTLDECKTACRVVSTCNGIYTVSNVCYIME